MALLPLLVSVLVGDLDRDFFGDRHFIRDLEDDLAGEADLREDVLGSNCGIWAPFSDARVRPLVAMACPFDDGSISSSARWYWNER